MSNPPYVETFTSVANGMKLLLLFSKFKDSL
jgi:hypothetical protein